ncbi:carbohydrate kinase family protein [Herbiconiux flava]|uniref:Sugar/nucleoside kinase (Ribokinase family) n=1 Tax=Herbiconiux flava TaxID=881268 RepID=A0A852SRY3_9MICO|nr:PfkB family carbohydrate kinase [Herbiconiux flava]NYD71617.1 sugar/nucleoside kinase (ribokinase family) [Herbiconiux flava]GLK18419.1 sugar kinase [Herbiconiux flava]
MTDPRMPVPRVVAPLAAPRVTPLPAAPRVIAFGDVFDDVIVTPAGDIRPDTDTAATIERRSGGSAANAAAWFGHLGAEAHFFGRVGTADVDRHTSELAEAGVAAHLLADVERPTGTIVVVLQPDRTRTMLTERGANVLTGPADVDRSLLAPGAHLHLTGYSLFNDVPGAARLSAVRACAALIADATAAGMTISVNPGSAGFIADHGAATVLDASRGATVLLPNLDEGRALIASADPAAPGSSAVDPAEVATALLAHAPVVALTMGRGGVLAAVRRAHGHPLVVRVPALLVDPVDTTGAGDAFSAGFVHALLTGGPVVAEAIDEARLERAAREGVRCAAIAIQRLGARPPIAEQPERVRA